MVKWTLTYADPLDASDATFEMHSHKLNGKRILVQPHMNGILLIKNVNASVTEGDIRHLFGRFGEIESLVCQDETIKIELEQTNSAYQKFYETGAMSDLTIHIDNESFPVHRVVLAAQSGYFYDLLTLYTQNELEMNHLRFFQEFLELMYGYPVQIKGLDTIRFLQTLDFLQVSELNFERIINEVNVRDDEFVEFFNLVEQLYPEGLPEKIHKILINKIPKDLPLIQIPKNLLG